MTESLVHNAIHAQLDLTKEATSPQWLYTKALHAIDERKKRVGGEDLPGIEGLFRPARWRGMGGRPGAYVNPRKVTGTDGRTHDLKMGLQGGERVGAGKVPLDYASEHHENILKKIHELEPYGPSASPNDAAYAAYEELGRNVDRRQALRAALAAKDLESGKYHRLYNPAYAPSSGPTGKQLALGAAGLALGGGLLYGGRKLYQHLSNKKNVERASVEPSSDPEKTAEQTRFLHDPTDSPEPEGPMIKGQLYRICDMATELDQILDDDDELPGWVTHHISVAQENLEQVLSYIQPRAKMSSVMDKIASIEYHGHTFPGYNKPIKSSNPEKKMMVLAKKGDEVRLIHFGQRGYKHNYSSSAKKNYLTRSAGIRNKSGGLTKDDKFSANYWARRVLWPKGETGEGKNGPIDPDAG